MNINLIIPFTEDAKKKTEELKIDLSNPSEELIKLTKSALIQIMKKEFKFPEVDEKFLTNYFAFYPLARIILSHINKERFYSAFSNFYFELAKRNIKDVKETLDLLDIKHKETPKFYLIPFQTYIKPKIHSTKDKLTNQKVYRGNVYLNEESAKHFIARVISARVVENLPLDVKNTAGIFKITAQELDILFKPKVSQINMKSGKIDFAKFPPCMTKIMETMLAKGNPRHMERYYFATFLFNLKMDLEQVLEIFKNTSDYNEKIAKYQLERIQRYSSPNCATVKSAGFCYEEEFCKQIKSPLGYYYKKMGWRFAEKEED